MKTKIFLSHAAADDALAAEFTRLLASGLGITGKEVFCSSLPGRKIPGGFNFVDHIKTKLADSQVVVLLITENYLVSQFCLAEIGASWISKDRVVPVVVPPITYARLIATLSIQQAWKLNDDDGLNGIADDICNALKIETNHAQWGVEKKAFLTKIESLIKDQKMPKVVSTEDFDQLKTELDYSQKTINTLREEVEQKDAHILAIKNAKNADEIRTIELASLSEMEGFEGLAAELTRTIDELPTAAAQAVYYHVRGESLPIPEFGYGDSEDRWREINAASKKKMLSNEAPITLNEDHPKVRKALEALSRLEDYMNENEDVLRPLIEEEYEVTYSLGDEDFWGQFIG